MPILQLTINSIIAGSIVSLVASGFSLIYGANQFAHFAHGAVVAAGGYIVFWLSSLLGLPFAVSVLGTILICAGIGLLLYFSFYHQLRRRNASSVVLLIGSIALMILIENIILFVFGASAKSLTVFPIQKGVLIGSAAITPLQIAIVAVTILLFIGISLFTKYSRFGKVMRAVSDNPDLARITGIDVVRVQATSFAIGSALAGVAGILIALEQTLLPSMGTNLIIRGFAGAVIGGVGSIPGAFLGSYILGFVENFGIWFVDSSYKELISFTVLLLFLFFRPTGVLGIDKGTRK